MKTRDRILNCALELFNRDGEPNVTTLDIANELGISPATCTTTSTARNR